MFGMRCETCGEVRWSLRAREDEAETCPVCGTAMVVERRSPGHHREDLTTERREAPELAAAGPAVSPG